MYEIPKHIIRKKDKYIIEDHYGMNYKIILNPFPTFFAETILLHNNPIANTLNLTNSFQTDTDNDIVLPDPGKLPSLRKITYPEEIIPHISNYINVIDKSAVSFLEINLIDMDNVCPLSENDVFYILKYIKDINGLAMLRVLPFGYSDYKNFGSMSVKVLKLPLKEIEYETLPLEIKIEQSVRDLKREKIKNISEANNMGLDKVKMNVLLDNEELTNFFEINEFFHVKNFSISGINHLVKNYNMHNSNAENVLKDIKKMLKELNITNQSGYGFNLLLSKSYLFITPLIRPFIFDKNNIPIFAEPNFYTGICTLPLIEAEWPNTVDNEYVKYNLEEILRKSSSE